MWATNSKNSRAAYQKFSKSSLCEKGLCIKTQGFPSKGYSVHWLTSTDIKAVISFYDLDELPFLSYLVFLYMKSLGIKMYACLVRQESQLRSRFLRLMIFISINFTEGSSFRSDFLKITCKSARVQQQRLPGLSVDPVWVPAVFPLSLSNKPLFCCSCHHACFE